MKGSEENDEFLDDEQSSGRPFEVDEVTASGYHEDEGSGENHLGFIDRWNPIPSLKRLIERMFPPRRSAEP